MNVDVALGLGGQWVCWVSKRWEMGGVLWFWEGILHCMILEVRVFLGVCWPFTSHRCLLLSQFAPFFGLGLESQCWEVIVSGWRFCEVSQTFLQ